MCTLSFSKTFNICIFVDWLGPLKTYQARRSQEVGSSPQCGSVSCLPQWQISLRSIVSGSQKDGNHSCSAHNAFCVPPCLVNLLVSAGGWQAVSHLFLGARAQGPSQRLNCFLIPKPLLIFVFYSFSNNGRVFGARHTSWLVPLWLSGLLSCVLISDNWKTSHLDFLTPPPNF